MVEAEVPAKGEGSHKTPLNIAGCELVEAETCCAAWYGVEDKP